MWGPGDWTLHGKVAEGAAAGVASLRTIKER